MRAQTVAGTEAHVSWASMAPVPGWLDRTTGDPQIVPRCSTPGRSSARRSDRGDRPDRSPNPCNGACLAHSVTLTHHGQLAGTARWVRRLSMSTATRCITRRWPR
jgi:hypothetical protein